MRNLAPNITRQRLLVEGFFTIPVSKATVLSFFKGITKELGLRVYGNPTIHVTGGKGKKINQGFDAFIPLIDSGIALYVWENAQFFSTVIYTCKKFDNKKAIKFVKKFFRSERLAFQNF